MTSQTKLLTLKFYFFQIFELVTPCEKIFNIITDINLEFYLEIFKEKKISELLTRKQYGDKISELLTLNNK